MRINKLKSYFCFVLVGSLFFTTTVARASINRAALVLAKPSKYFGPQGQVISPELVDSYNQIKAQTKPFDMTQIIPSDIQASADSGFIFARIADQSISSLFNSAEMRATPIGKTATDVEKKLKQDVTLSQGQVLHKFTFQVQAFQSVARVDYTGYANATLKYQAADSSLGLEVFEKISKSKEVVVAHLNKPTDRVSSLSLRWNF